MSKNQSHAQELKDLAVQEKRELRGSQEGTRSGVYFEPNVDIWENESLLTLVMDLPGTDAQKIETDLRDNVLTVTAHVEELEPRWKPIYQEFRIGHFTRQFRVGQKVDQGKISAKVKDGVLTLTLPKAAAAMPRKIEVGAAE